MKPVNKGISSKSYSKHTHAKPDLIAKAGEYCSYCERLVPATHIHVEHIYPQLAHPHLVLVWSNFLLACTTCNNYKKNHLGNEKQVRLIQRYLWPHVDNTFKAFTYTETGAVNIANSIPVRLFRKAKRTLGMAGLMRSPAVTKNYEESSISYDGVSLRRDMWKQAVSIREIYAKAPSAESAKVFANNAALMGYFSVWMEVFKDCKEVRMELIRAFKADPNCFDSQTQPAPKGRIR